MRIAAAFFAALLLAGCGAPPEPAWSGYAEADSVYVSAPLAGTLARLEVEAGQQVSAGQPLFALDAEAERGARDEARARLASASFLARNVDTGKRDAEVALALAQLGQARAAVEFAQKDHARKRELVTNGAVSKSDADLASAVLEQAQARVAELTAAVQVARLPARIDERHAAAAQVEAARQQLRQVEWRAQQAQQAAPAAGVVSDTFFRPGEFVAAGQPVLALLPPGHIKARFFVAQEQLPRVALGQRVHLACDGCGAPIDARVSFIATQPEYTPPVIYSNAQRSKLVFLVEAKPAAADAARLRPGQPLDVRAAAAGK